MPVGFGAEPIKNEQNQVTSGTTDTDIRRIYGSLFTPGLINGGVVGVSASSMAYSVSAGVAAFKMANNEIVLGPIPQTNSLIPVGVSGTTHVIYAQQNTQAADGDNQVVVKVGATLPSIRAVRLATFTVPAGATRSNQGVRTGNVDYAIPYGSGLGTLVSHQDTLNGNFSADTTVTTKSFYVPSDRQVEFIIQTTIGSADAVGWDNSKYTEAGYRLYLDNAQIAEFGSPGLAQAWNWVEFNQLWNVSQGNHTVRVTRRRIHGPGTPRQYYSPGSTIGLRFRAVDLGVAV